MKALQIILITMAIASQCLALPDEDGKKGGKSAQNSRVSFNSNRDTRNRDNDLLFNRNNRNSILGTDIRRPIQTITPQPQIITVTTPRIGALGGAGGLFGGGAGGLFGGSRGVLGGSRGVFGLQGNNFLNDQNPFGQIYSPGTLGLTNQHIHQHQHPQQQFDQNLAIYARDPNYILNQPQLLILHPQLAIIHARVFQQFPNLRHYVSPYVMELVDRRINSGGITNFNRVFPGSSLDGLTNSFGSRGFTNFGNSGLDLNRPIDTNRPFLSTGSNLGFNNRPFLSTVSPLGFNNPSRSIRF